MSLLQSIITQVAKNALSENQQGQQNRHNHAPNTGGLSDVLGGMLGSSPQRQADNGFGLDDIIGGVLGQNNNNSFGNNALGGLLSSVLGGQSKQSIPAGDLGSVLGGLLAGGLGKSAGRGFNKNTLLLALLPLVLGYIQKNGGLSGVLAKFNQLGLQNKAQSFVNIGDNDGLDEDEIEQLLGRDEIAQMSEQTGASESDVRTGLATLLPQLMNDLTPRGNLDDDENDANNEISDILQQFAQARR